VSGDKKSDPKLPQATLLELYRHMVTVRRFDELMLQLQRQGRIGFYGPIKGQEAATVGSGFAAGPDDWIVPALREGYLSVMRGLPLELAIAQLIGNSLDLVKGRQMPCHFTWKAGRYVAMSSVIGTQISHATGIAMAARYRKDPAVVLGYLGDGATSSNDFHCGLNFAAVSKAPVVFVCQNNHWSISVPAKAQTASESFAVKAVAYGMPGVLVDGNDVLAVYSATSEAIARARKGDGPTLIECRTYRRLGHSSSDDPTKYRDDKEVAEWEKRDPIDRFRAYLEKRKLWDGKRDEALREQVAAQVSKAVQAVETAPMPGRDTMFADVFRELTPQLEEQQRGATS
jgi:pyruvate dehydrogenase E1 component alpha subunit